MDEYKLYLQGDSVREVSEKTDISISKLRTLFTKAGIYRTRAEAVRIAAKKGLMSTLKGTNRVFTKQWKDNMRKAAIKRGKETAVGVSLKPSGYYEHTTGENKGRSVHVVLMEEIIGRRTFSNEVVHHVNGLRDDNRIENLQLMTRKDHCSYHSKLNHKNGVAYDISKESRKGELHPQTKLKDAQVIDIYNAEGKYKILAEKYDVSISCIKHIKQNRNWKHLNLNK